MIPWLIARRGYGLNNPLSIATRGYLPIEIIIEEDKKSISLLYNPFEDKIESKIDLTKQHQQLIVILRAFLLCH